MLLAAAAEADHLVAEKISLIPGLIPARLQPDGTIATFEFIGTGLLHADRSSLNLARLRRLAKVDLVFASASVSTIRPCTGVEPLALPRVRDDPQRDGLR